MSASLDDAAALGHLLGLRFVQGGGHTYSQVLAGKGQAGATFSAAQLCQDRSKPAWAILLTASLAPPVCIARERVLEQSRTLSAALLVFTPPSLDASGSLGYISLRLRDATLSFGFTQQRPECVSSVVVNRRE